MSLALDGSVLIIAISRGVSDDHVHTENMEVELCICLRRILKRSLFDLARGVVG
jgi:hypothetical protein